MALGVPAKLRLDAVQPDQITYPGAGVLRNWERYRKELRRID